MRKRKTRRILTTKTMCPAQTDESTEMWDKCDIAFEEAGLLGSPLRQKKADWVEQEGGVGEFVIMSSALPGGVQDIADKLRLPCAANES